MKNGTLLLTKKKSNNYESLKKINTLDSSTSSSVKPIKLKLRNDFSSIMKFNENTSPKKVLDFPICLSLFTNNNSINDIDFKKKEKQKNQLNLNLKSLRPKNLNNLNLNDIIKPNKKIISRNSNSKYFSSLSPINSKKVSSLTKIFSHERNKNVNLNYSPTNLEKSPIIINQIGLSPILKFNNRKLNTLSQNSSKQDISLIKNIKGLSINNLNYNINFTDKRIIPSLIPSPLSSENLPRVNAEKINCKKKIYQMENKMNNSVNKKNEKKEINNQRIKARNLNKETELTTFSSKNILNNKVITADDNNEIKIFENRINNNKISTFFKESKKSVKRIFDMEERMNIRTNKKFPTNELIYRIFPKSNSIGNIFNKIEISSELKENEIEKSEVGKKNKMENIKEKSIKNNINDNKEKLDRLKRLKQSCFKAGNNKKTKVNLTINDIKEKEITKNDNIKEKNNFSKPKRKKTFFIGLEKEDRKSQNFKIGINEKIRKIKTSKMVIPSDINEFKIRKNKFYLTICKKKTINIYKKNKFLEKCNNKLNEISSNNRINRKIYVKKTQLLLNMQDKVSIIINSEKTKLKQFQLDMPDTKIFFENILKTKKKKINITSNIIKSFIETIIFNCNISFCLYNYINTSIDFNGFPNNILTVKNKNLDHKEIFRSNTKKISRKTITRRPFQTVMIKKIPPVNLQKENNKVEFLVNKSKDIFKEDMEWTYSPVNLLSIQEMILRSNIDYLHNRRNALNKTKKRVRLKSNSLDFTKKDENENFPFLKQMTLKRLSVLNFSELKNNIKKMPGYSNNFQDYSLLYQKKFFKRKIIKKDEINNSLSKKKRNNNSSYDYSSDRLSSSNSNEIENLDDIYFELLSHIIEGRNKQFFKLYEKNSHLIDINQQLIEGNTLLIVSAREGNYILTNFLCSQGIKVNLQNDKGNTALHYAIGNQFYSIADILTKHGAREDIANNKGLFPWDCVENNLE